MPNDSVKYALRLSLAGTIGIAAIILVTWFSRTAGEFVCARAGVGVGWATPVTFFFLLGILFGSCWLVPIRVGMFAVRSYVRFATFFGLLAAAVVIVLMLGTGVGAIVAACVGVFGHLHLSEDSALLLALPFILGALFAFGWWINKRSRIIPAARRWANSGIEMSAQEQEAKMLPFLILARPSAARIDAHTGFSVLEYGPAMKGAALTAAITVPLGVVVLGICGYLFLPREAGDEVFIVRTILGLSGFFAICGTYLLIGTLRVKVYLTYEGVRACAPWPDGHRFIKWDDIREVKYPKTGKEFIIEGNDGTRIRVNLYLAGILSLVDAFRANLPPEKFQGAGKGIERVEAGRSKAEVFRVSG